MLSIAPNYVLYLAGLCALIPFNYAESFVYDRQTLLDNRSSCVDVFDMKIGNFMDSTYRSALRVIPDFNRRWPKTNIFIIPSCW